VIVPLQDAADASLGTASSTSVRNLVMAGNISPIQLYLDRSYSVVVPLDALLLREDLVAPRDRNTGGFSQRRVHWFQFDTARACNQVPADGCYVVRVYRGGEGAGEWASMEVDGGREVCQVDMLEGLDLRGLREGHIRVDIEKRGTIGVS
jgi:hypothetical protein